jgi:hypothetical protein
MGHMVKANSSKQESKQDRSAKIGSADTAKSSASTPVAKRQGFWTDWRLPLSSLSSLEGLNSAAIAIGIILAIALIASVPMIMNSYPITHSTHFNLSWAFQYQRQFFSGQFYPRWLEFSNFGFGNATFAFYPPMCMATTLPFRALGLSLSGSLIASMTLAIFTLGIGMYLYARLYFPRWLAIVVAALGAIAPYFLADIYMRGALGEVWAIVFIPWILWATQRVIDRPQPLRIVTLAIAYGMLVLSHLPTLLIFTLVWWLFPLLVKNRRLGKGFKARFSTIKSCYLGFLLAIAWTGFFIVPVVLEQKLIQLQMLTFIADYQAQHRLMLDGILTLQPRFTEHWFDSKLIPMWLVVFVTLVLGYVNWFNHRFKHLAISRQSDDTTGLLQATDRPEEREKLFKLKQVALVWLLMGTIAMLMTTDVLGWIYQLVPTLNRIQFSFRWFSIPAIVYPLLCGYLLFRVQRWFNAISMQMPETIEPLKKVAIAGVLISLIGFVWLSWDIISNTQSRANDIHRFEQLAAQKQFPNEPPTAQAKGEQFIYWHWIFPEGLALVDVPEYRAREVNFPMPPDRDYALVEWKNGSSDGIEIKRWDFGIREFEVSLPPNGDLDPDLERDFDPNLPGQQIFLRNFYFPGWRVKIDGKTVPTRLGDRGRLAVNLPVGIHQVSVRYLGTASNWLGYLISFGSGLGILLWLKPWRKQVWCNNPQENIAPY